MAESEEVKEPSETEEEEQSFPLTLVLYTASREDFKVPMGQVTISQLQALHQTIKNAFDTLASSRDLILSDENGITKHFNTLQLVCVDVKVG